LSAPSKNIELQLIATKLKALRVEKGFSSYEQFAHEFDLDRKQYWRVENGANITINTLIKIVALHHLTLVQFFDLIR
jgi:transcriptional regulator with XRE-family HTH domain